MTKDDVKRYPGVESREGSRNWQFRRNAPDELAHLYPPSGIARRLSLRTSDLREANAKAARLWAETEDEFAVHRRALNPVVVETVTPELAATIAQAIRFGILGSDDRRRDEQSELIAFLSAWEGIVPSGSEVADDTPLSGTSDPDRPGFRRYLTAPPPAYLQPNPDGPLAGLSDAQRERLRVIHAAVAAQAATLRAGRNLAFAVPLSDAAARRAGVRVDWHAPQNREALRQCLDAMVEAWFDLAKRDAGQMVATPDTPATAPAPQPASSQSGRRIRDALDAWKEIARRNPRTVTTWTGHAEQFARIMGDPLLSSLRRADAVRFRDALQREAVEQKKTVRTADNILTSIKALANVARDREWIEGNPFERLTVKEGGTDSEGREPWTSEELVRLFDSPLFTAYALPSVRKAGMDAAYWLPLLAAYTGARPSEMAQLWTDDLSEGEGGLVVEFRANAERQQRLKNGASWRAVPIHSALIALGFRDYWTAIGEGGPRPLFPAVPKSGKNGAGSQFGQWFGHFKRGQGFDSKTKTLHSFRHTFEVELAFAHVTPTLVDAMTGHAGDGIGRKVYGATIRREAERLRPFVEKLAYPGLTLPVVFKAPAWRPETPATSPGPK